jgi:hypothetical protein
MLITTIAVDHTRVKLQDVEGGAGDDYINANYVSGRVPGKEKAYIAAQGCMDQTIASFWQMIYEQNCTSRPLAWCGKALMGLLACRSDDCHDDQPYGKWQGIARADASSATAPS